MFKTKNVNISVIEAHSLWALLTTKYDMVENVQLWLNFAHDTDLEKILTNFLKDLDEHINLIEKELNKYNIEGPVRPREILKANVNTEIMSDEHIARQYFTFLQEMIEKVILSIQYSIYNDNVSKFFTKFSNHTLEQTDTILKYLKVKGWLRLPPVYTNIPSETKEKLDCIEAYHLWTHVSYRNTNIEETSRWKEYIHDIDFKSIITMGLKKMKKQVDFLEKELQYFGIPSPKRPPNVIAQKVNDCSNFTDEYIYKSLHIGLEWAGVFHANAFKHCVTNDRIRNIFKDLIYEEIDLVNDMSKFGKMKGWLEVPPLYNIKI